MDEEDLRDSQKKLNLPKVEYSGFKINFLWIFVICIAVMILEQAIKLSNNIPPLFNGGDCLYHFLESAFSICSQLSASIAAAIVFYYVTEFINAKRRISDFSEIRKHIVFILYSHMKIVCSTKSFSNLNRNKRRLEGSNSEKMFLTVDIPIFWDCYSKSDNNILSKELNEYFHSCHNSQECRKDLIYILKSFEKDIENLISLKKSTFYKGYSNDIENLKSIYEEIKGWVTVYNSNNDTECFEHLIEDYILFLSDSIKIYHIMERFIHSIEYADIVEYMKLME